MHAKSHKTNNDDYCLSIIRVISRWAPVLFFVLLLDVCLFYRSASFAKVSQRFLEDEGRYNYTTPKSFLELIDFYKELLRKKRGELNGNINRLANGLETLRKTNNDVQVRQFYLLQW